ncbi:MAG TPA: PEP-CTERM sorting domain-containing protein [Pirellulales bacterium]|nr:PEP-CTERM sorting domain-containing protein [Pirellulales bacterium]
MSKNTNGDGLRIFSLTPRARRSRGRRRIGKRRLLLAAAAVWPAAVWLAAGGGRAEADILASAAITAQQVSPGEYQYDITLDDIGTTNIATFWYAWVPGEGFLASQPTNITGPAGWTDTVTDTYAIRWEDAATPLVAGNSLSGFQFDSSDTPSEVFGMSVAYPTTPVDTSVVYATAPPSGSSDQFVVTSPEPSTLAMLAAGTLGLMLAARRRARK